MFKKTGAFLKAQLTQGVSPSRLALSCAMGAIVGLCPLFGITTLLGVIAGVALRLNQPTLQAVNYLMAAPQLLMIPVFLRLGETMFAAPHVSLDPRTLVTEFYSGPLLFFSHYGWAALQATVAWATAAPFIAAAIFVVMRFILSRVAARLG